MNFEDLKFKDLDSLAVQYLIFDTKELAHILKSHLYIEQILERLIKKKIPKPNHLFKNQISFSLKLDLALSLNAIPEKYVGPIKSLNGIRNKYAHNANYQVTFDDLNALKLEWEQIQYRAYEKACEKGIEEAVMTL